MVEFPIKIKTVKSLLILSVVFFSILSLLACNINENDDDSTTLKLWMHQGAENEILPDVIEGFKAAYPGINVQIIQPPEYDYFKFLVASSRTGSLPDVFDVDAPNIAYMVNIDALLPFDEVEGMTRDSLDQLKSEFFSAIVDQGTIENQLYTLGSYNASVGIYYNKLLVTQTLLDNAGVSGIPTCSDEAWTWDTFEQVLAVFTNENPDKYGFIMDFDTGEGNADELLTFFYLPIIYSNDQEVIDEVTTRMRDYLNAPGAVEALERFNHFIHKETNGVFKENTSISGPAEEYFKEFKEGRAAFCWHGHWKYNELKGNWNGTAWEGGLGDNLKIMPLPRFSGKNLRSPTGSYSWAISSRTLHSKTALELIKYLTSATVQKAFIEGVDNKPGSDALPTKEAARMVVEPYSDCEGQDCDALCPASLTDDRCIFVDQSKCTAKVRPITPAYGVFTSDFAQIIRQISEDPSTDINQGLTDAAIAHDEELERLLR
jgi:fructooligosaccharide transport system substrate-binding protein